MKFNDDLTACAAIVERADPLRFRAAMAAPLAARRVLFPLYAFNIEVARAPWVTQEAMIAEMRLQWWRDVCDEIGKSGAVRRHEVATPLGAVIAADQAHHLDTLVGARRWDIYRDPFEDEAHFDAYIDQTAGSLMWVAASSLGTADEVVVRDAGYGAGVAAWLQAIPQLVEQGRIPLLDGTDAGVSALARKALTRLEKARQSRGKVSAAARPALFSIGASAAVLEAAIETPSRVGSGTLPPLDRFALSWRALSGRW
ncbi:Squalene/phytoene synthase [Sulfitobacter marinus]|uniref:Squalene/phytoene synthase n=1 Tax=Sulfitobacter marinus TaxID=394264 RepID=A0A1I6QYK7_9RHOB|nr:squalene/phytoene synthase family protein [Sulfitobacter marinus]SFS57338.1 Squalene/phytoene synthase [Sulfitobacter marinus]